MLEIFVDADACPVKDEVERVADRHGLIVHIVTNGGIRPSANPRIRHVIVPEGPDAADDWIAERIGPFDIAVTADIPLASRCLKKQASVLGPTGRKFTAGDHRHGAGDARSFPAFARSDGPGNLQREFHQTGSLAISGRARKRDSGDETPGEGGETGPKNESQVNAAIAQSIASGLTLRGSPRYRLCILAVARRHRNDACHGEETFNRPFAPDVRGRRQQP